jgi:GGDEF domain-containing protein
VRGAFDPRYPGEAAAERLVRAARAAQELSDALWGALQEELRHPPDAQRVRELSARLADVVSAVAMLAAPLGGLPPDPSLGGFTDGTSPARDREAPPAGPRETTPPAGSREATPAGSGGPASSDRVERRTPPEPSRPTVQEPVSPRPGDYAYTKIVDERERTTPLAPPPSIAPIAPEIEVRDVRREEGPTAWVSSVGALLARHDHDGLPFAVLLVEIVDVARLERSETPHDMHGLVKQVEDALGRGMRATDSLSRENLGRYWMVAPETNGTGARMLAERLARLVRTSASHRGVPLEVAIGIAVCPDDGTEAPALAARADLGVYSARATGRTIAHTEPPPAG